MKISRMGISFSKSRSDEESLSNEILFQSSQLKRHAAGIYGLGHFLTRARNKLVEVLRRNLEGFGCAEVVLPILQPKSLWQLSGRFETFTAGNQMFTFEGRNGVCCLAPTGEEIVLDFVKNNIESYKKLPINIFQIGNKYRDEIRVRGGLMRSKEFLMKDGYSFHASFDDMVREYELMKKCYKKIFSELELDTIVVKAVSAAMGGKVSEEFMTVHETGEDKILLDSSRGIALNVEVLENESLLAELKNGFDDFSVESLKEVNCIELGHIFQLGTFYSEKMNGLFVDRDGLKKPYFMGCYGIGVNRVLGAICEIRCDEEGLNWPSVIAPYKIAIVYSKNYERHALEVYDRLVSVGVEVVLFDSDDGFGSKIRNAKLLGFSQIAIVGRTFEQEGKVEVEGGRNQDKRFMNIESLVDYLGSF